ncbi:MAG: hypothetical protein ABH871_04460 [Pseudomonadota bacterium]
MGMIRCLLKFIFFIVEKVMAELALLAALLSITETGSYVDRVIGGMLDILYAIYGFVHAYVANISFREFMTTLSTGIIKQLAAIGDNIQADPRRALIAIIATYVTYKVIPLLLRLIRKKLLKGKKGDDESQNMGDRSKMVEELYEDQHTPSDHNAAF